MIIFFKISLSNKRTKYTMIFIGKINIKENVIMDKRLVVITGASSGIGKATAKRLSNEGYPLLLIARRAEKLEELNFPNTLCMKVDVTDRKSFEDAIKAAEDKFGPVDCIINNAGKMLLGQIDAQNPEEWKTMSDLNVLAVLNGIQIVLSGMKERKRGTIINIGSIAGKKSFGDHAAYCGTKFAVHAINETIREEHCSDNIRVTTIAPGAVETELLSHTTSKAIIEGYEEFKKSMDGALEPDDIARAISFAYNQPQNVNIREIDLSATKQQA